MKMLFKTIEADNHAATVHEKNKKNSLQGTYTFSLVLLKY